MQILKDDRISTRLIRDLLKDAFLRDASDLHLSVGASPVLRIDGILQFSVQEAMTCRQTQEIFEAISTKVQQAIFVEKGEIDFTSDFPGYGRIRVNVFKQRGTVALALRLVNNKIRSLDDLGCPDILKSLAMREHGLVLIAGSAGSGKSTTLAAMIDLINRTKSAHIVTLEDPIEYLHQHHKSIVNQREIYSDSLSFANGLRAALREDPDVILIGELRDAETMATAITAAETGHLVLATLHTCNAPQAVERIIDAFAPHAQQQIRTQLAMSLEGIVVQRLLKRKDGAGRIPAFEVLLATAAVRSLIREGKTYQLISDMQTGAKWGMRTMEASMKELMLKGLIVGEAVD